MNVVADEGVDRPIVERLRTEGHTVTYVAEVSPSAPDDAVLDLADRQGCPLLTADKDFGEIVFRQGRLTTGILLIRLAGIAPEDKADIVATVIRDHGAELAGAFTVVTAVSVRIRKLGP